MESSPLHKILKNTNLVEKPMVFTKKNCYSKPIVRNMALVLNSRQVGNTTHFFSLWISWILFPFPTNIVYPHQFLTWLMIDIFRKPLKRLNVCKLPTTVFLLLLSLSSSDFIHKWSNVQFYSLTITNHPSYWIPVWIAVRRRLPGWVIALRLIHCRFHFRWDRRWPQP